MPLMLARGISLVAMVKEQIPRFARNDNNREAL